MWNIVSKISEIFQPVADVVDELHTSEEEKLTLKAKLLSIQTQMASILIEYEKKLLEYQSKVLNAEATGHSWLQRNWRPITMLVFVALITATWLGWTPPGLDEELQKKLFDIVQIGIGGYIVGRSAEKIVQMYRGKEK